MTQSYDKIYDELLPPEERARKAAEALRIARLTRNGLLKGLETIKAGELVAFTTGEYSDYSVSILLRAKTDFTNEDMLNAVEKSGACGMVESYIYNEPQERFDEDKLIAYLASLDCFEEVSAREIHLGDYGRVAIDDYGYLGK